MLIQSPTYGHKTFRIAVGDCEERVRSANKPELLPLLRSQQELHH